jgi:hypothetical protein
MKKRFIQSAALALVLSGCGDRDRPVTPEQMAEREAAFRQACAAQELALAADENLATIQTSLLTLDPKDPASAVSRAATEAAIQYSTAYQGHAALQLGAYAHLDSAVNNATTTADSARYIERAGSFTIRNPEAGTLEANVINAYQADFLQLLEDPNHRCNWDTPFDTEEAAR